MVNYNNIDKKIWVKGLLVKCPLEQPLDTCPAKEIRELPLKERLAVVDKMTDAQIKSILDHHQLCLLEREGW